MESGSEPPAIEGAAKITSSEDIKQIQAARAIMRKALDELRTTGEVPPQWRKVAGMAIFANDNVERNADGWIPPATAEIIIATLRAIVKSGDVSAYHARSALAAYEKDIK